MIATLVGIACSAALFAAFGLLRRGRETEERARGCGCARPCGACTWTAEDSTWRAEHVEH